MRLQESSTDSLDQQWYQYVCLKKQATFFHQALWLVTMNRYTIDLSSCGVISKTTQYFPHNVINFRILWLYISQGMVMNSVRHLRIEACRYILNMLHMMTHVNVHLDPTHITDFELLTCTCIKKSSFQGKAPQIMLLFIKLSHRSWFTHRTVSTACLWDSNIYFCFYLFIFFLTCSVQFLKKMWFWIWGNWRSCTKCSETNWLKLSKMPTCSDWL